MDTVTGALILKLLQVRLYGYRVSHCLDGAISVCTRIISQSINKNCSIIDYNPCR